MTDSRVGESSFSLILLDFAFYDLYSKGVSAKSRRVEKGERDENTLVGFFVALPTATSILPPICEKERISLRLSIEYSHHS